jgi:hypothetical protein
MIRWPTDITAWKPLCCGGGVSSRGGSACAASPSWTSRCGACPSQTRVCSTGFPDAWKSRGIRGSTAGDERSLDPPACHQRLGRAVDGAPAPLDHREQVRLGGVLQVAHPAVVAALADRLDSPRGRLVGGAPGTSAAPLPVVRCAVGSASGRVLEDGLTQSGKTCSRVSLPPEPQNAQGISGILPSGAKSSVALSTADPTAWPRRRQS